MDLISIALIASSSIILFLSLFFLLIFLDNMDLIWKDPKPKKLYSITAIIPAYNEEEFIERCARSVAGQDYDKKLFDIIVVNDGSSDKTKEICERLKKEGLSGASFNRTSHRVPGMRRNHIFFLRYRGKFWRLEALRAKRSNNKEWRQAK